MGSVPCGVYDPCEIWPGLYPIWSLSLGICSIQDPLVDHYLRSSSSKRHLNTCPLLALSRDTAGKFSAVYLVSVCAL